jgi:hypothetical protein
MTHVTVDWDAGVFRGLPGDWQVACQLTEPGKEPAIVGVGWCDNTPDENPLAVVNDIRAWRRDRPQADVRLVARRVGPPTPVDLAMVEP